MARKVLVCMGGSDDADFTSVVIRGLAECGLDLEAKIVVGPANPNLDVIRQESERSGCCRLVLAPEKEMVSIMNWADLALTGAGSICWELAYMGVPSILVVLAENQERTAVGLARRGAAVNLGRSDHVHKQEIAKAMGFVCGDRAGREEMSLAGLGLVDGLGAERIIACMMEGQDERD